MHNKGAGNDPQERLSPQDILLLLQLLQPDFSLLVSLLIGLSPPLDHTDSHMMSGCRNSPCNLRVCRRSLRCEAPKRTCVLTFHLWRVSFPSASLPAHTTSAPKGHSSLQLAHRERSHTNTVLVISGSCLLCTCARGWFTRVPTVGQKLQNKPNRFLSVQICDKMTGWPL